MVVYNIFDMKIKTNISLCNKKKELLYNFYKKCDNCDRSETLSQYYENVLEVIKFIEQYFLHNSIFLKNIIKLKGNNDECYTPLNEFIQSYTMFVFEINDDDYEIDLSQEEIDNFVNIIEIRTATILQNQDIDECFNL